MKYKNLRVSIHTKSMLVCDLSLSYSKNLFILLFPKSFLQATVRPSAT